jgi:amino acid adenylation domain-containing protein
MNNLYQQIAALTPEQRALFEQRLKQRGIQHQTTIPRRDSIADAPLSFAQQRLWFIQQLDPTNASYNVFSALQLKGDLNLPALQNTLDRLIQRHETLRTTFTTNAEKQPIQVIAPPQSAHLPIVDLSDRPDPQSSAQQLALEASQLPFDLSKSLLRLSLLRLSLSHHILLITVHHIISDRWSVGVFLREMTTLYHAFIQNQPDPLPELSIQYADWAVWQRQSLQGEKLEAQIHYWQNQLKDLTLLDLPTDRPRPQQPTYQGDQCPISFSAELSNSLKSLSRQSGTTLFTLILAAFQVLLHRYTQQDDITVGTDIANRDRTETEGLIGLLVNTLVLRTNLAGNPSFRELLERSRQVMLDAIAHQDLPFEKLVEVINPDRDLQQMMPLFQVKLDLQLATVKPLELEGLSIDRLPLETVTAKYELRLNLQDTEQGINGQIEYSTDLFDAATIRRMASHLQILLEGIVANPDQRLSQLPMLTAAEQPDERMEKSPRSALCIHHLFETQVSRTPDAIALRWQDQPFTYQTLNVAANQRARYLQSLGVTAETRVAVCLERSPDLIITLLAILKAGGAYVPLDPAYPQERQKFILEDAQVSVLITQSSLCQEQSDKLKIILIDTDLQNNQDDFENLKIQAKENNLAYIIYTSGSTGKPKGVAIEHHSTVTLIHWAKETFSSESLAGVLASTSVCFDLSVFEIFVPLSWGGTVILADNALQLPALPAAHHITLINTVPSAIAQLLRLNAIPPSVNTVNLAGEALSQTLVQQLYQLPHIQHVYNLYGPSEDTTYSTYARVTPEQSPPPIGVAIAHTQVHVLDRHLNTVPVGVVGELYLGGDGLARGYLHRPELTAEKFIPTAHGRLYRTGDLVRRLADGNLQYQGRIDHQIKLRGFRIELGEIEAVLCQHPDILEAVVTIQSDMEQANTVQNENRRLIAYICPNLPADLRAFLQSQLPSYMLPTHFVALDFLPRLPNGKLDRHALPTPSNIHPTLENAYVPPQGDIEEAIAQIWQEELQVKPIGRHDNFFELGGHSLLGITVISRVNETVHPNIPLRQLFQSPTIAGLSSSISNIELQHNIIPSQRIIPDPTQRHQPFPLTDIQQAYWIGRNEAFELGNISTHGYREIEIIGFTVEQVEQALQILIQRHDMLRMIVQPDGQQRILPQVPPFHIPTHDLRNQSPSVIESTLLELRDRLSHQIIPTDRYPLFDIQAALWANKVRFCISFDVLIADAASIQQIAQELVQLLHTPHSTLPPLSLSFRDYVLAVRQQTNDQERSWSYWQSRLDTLPPAPELPLAKNPAAIATPHFVRRSGELPPSQWQALKQKAAQLNLTPSSVLLTAFAEVLSAWSKQPTFTLNLTLFNRLPLHPEVNQLIGDFTSSTLLAIPAPAPFADRAQQLQAQLWQDLDHRHVSGIAVLRELARQQQRITGALIPVVFTSILTQSPHRSPSVPTDWAEVVYSLSQTSQVYLDHQVAEVEGTLVFNWDAIEELFPTGLLNDLFAAYEKLLAHLAAAPDWNAPLTILPALPAAPSAPQNPALLHQLFWEQADRHPNQIALIAPDFTCTYAELRDRAHQIAHQLQPYQLQPNELVAIVMEKGWEQVVAVLGILAAGAAYVPIDPDLPVDRRQHLLSQAATRCILTQSHLDSLFQSNDLPRIYVDTLLDSPAPVPLPSPAQPTDLAYVIYTSGSTGLPKGVMIDHQAAVNTILDINQRFQITQSDRLLALSSLSFDLSVYDIFGTLAAGATLIIPRADQAQDPHHWSNLLTQHAITIWNSVPALMQLLLDTQSSAPLRLALLSGDWIPLSLPQQIRDRFPTIQVVSLGGATEAAIWSIFYPITTVNPDWRSIPYGKPLTQQQVHVLNAALQPCPTWVTGELYIGGTGVAQGYWHDPDKTSRSFIYHPATGERLYKTGDLGRTLPDGNIEFLGREDFQVKVNGYRIELGEIETALQQHPLIQDAVVTAVVENHRKQLVAYIIPSSVNKIDLKLQQRSIRQFSDAQSTTLLPASPQPSLRRQSYRQFLDRPLMLQQIGNWLSVLQSWTVPNAPLPKYRYASAGSLYPVQTYLYIKPDRVSNLSGFYYYHPVEHRLIFLYDASFDSAIYGSNQAIFDQAGFAVFLIADLDAIAPVYGDSAQEFCLVEAGYMSQLLMETAPDQQIGLCPVGKLDFAPIQPHFQLTNHTLLHSFIGGLIDPAWTEQWQPLPPTQPSIPDRLRQFLEQHLPAYMIPTAYVLLESFPLTANGKVDRRALPLPHIASPQEFVAPRTAVEQQIADIWQRSLSLDAVGIHDNFFDLGGNSVSATQVITQMRQAFQAELSIRQFFTQPTIAELAAQVSIAPSVQSVDIIPQRDRLPLELDQMPESDLDRLLQQMLEEADS